MASNKANSTVFDFSSWTMFILSPVLLGVYEGIEFQLPSQQLLLTSLLALTDTQGYLQHPQRL
jgi:hypothetical protein